MQDGRRDNELTERHLESVFPGIVERVEIVSGAVNLRQLYSEYHKTVQFLAIYIREAHPIDGWNMANAYKAYDPKTIEERRKIAGTCESTLAYGIKTYIDEMDDPVMTTYAAWPERMYLIDSDGRVNYAGGLGPWGFNPSELKEAIDKLIRKDK